MAHPRQNIPAGVDERAHIQLRNDYWTPFAGTWYRSNCTVEGSERCLGCGSAGGLVFAFHDGANGTRYSSAPPCAHLYCFARDRGLKI